jgi:hypothetical protein
VIQVDRQAFVADPLDNFRVVREQAVVGDILEIERRHHQHAGRAILNRVPGQCHRIAQ